MCWHSTPIDGRRLRPELPLAEQADRVSLILISQPSISDKLRMLLDSAAHRDRKIPSRGRLLDLFGLQVIQSDSFAADDSTPLPFDLKFR